METLLGRESAHIKELSPLDLAFVGDGVYDLLAREYLVEGGSCPVKKLHQRKAEWVCCGAQARILRAVWERLTQEERAVALRGRNAHVGHLPKNASSADYHASTALEAVFGWLYLRGEGERVRALFLMALEHFREEDGAGGSGE